MLKRTIEVSKEPAHLAVRLDQLVLERRGQPIGSAPCEDIGVLVVDHPGATYTHHALTRLAELDATVVLCGGNHLPVAIVLPLASHSQVVLRLTSQIQASRPLRKRLWKQIIRAKIRAQASNLPIDSAARRKLLEMCSTVRSGDPTNVEARAARHYWINWRPESSFRRNVDEGGLNALLNYGYAVMRAAIARAIVAAGLSPAVGLHHRHRANAFCLADDLIEPLRPMVDDCARELYLQGHDSLTQAAKAGLLELLADSVLLGEERGPLLVNLHRYVASLADCYDGKATKLEIPVIEHIAKLEKDSNRGETAGGIDGISVRRHRT